MESIKHKHKNPMYSIAEAATVLKVPSGQLARWVARGRIPSAVMEEGPDGKVWRLPRETVDAVGRQVHRAEQLTPVLAQQAVPESTGRPTSARASSPAMTQVKWREVEQIVARERAHWQRLSELHKDTISSLRNQLEEAQQELRLLRDQWAALGDAPPNDGVAGRSTLPMGRKGLLEMSFPQLKVP